MSAWSKLVVLGLACLGGTACASTAPADAVPPDAEVPRLMVCTWMNSGSERDAMIALYSLLRQRDPSIEIFSLADVLFSRDELPDLVTKGDSPDAFQVTGGTDIGTWIDMGALASLDATSADRGWSSVFPKPVLEDFSANGTLYAVPLFVERENALFYNKALL